MAAVSTNVYYKSLSATGSECTAQHDVLYGNSGTLPAIATGLPDQYVVWYDDSVGSFPSGPIYIDQFFNFVADPGFFASSPFDGTQTSSVTYSAWNGAVWQTGGTCIAGGGTPTSSVRTLDVYYSPTDPGNPNGEYCENKEKKVLYYDHSASFPTIEALIYHLQHVDPNLDVWVSLDGCNPPTVTDLTDPQQLANLQPLNDGYWGEELQDFYLYDGTDWYHAQNASTDYSATTIVPNQDPGSTSQSADAAGWVAFECPGILSTEIILNYGTTSKNYCDSPTSNIYYYFAGGTPKTLSEIYNEPLLLFTNEQAAIDYYYCPTSLSNVAPTGMYGETTSPNQFYTWESNSLKWIGSGNCVGVGVPAVRTIDINVAKCDDVTSDFVAICHHPTETVTVYYYSSSQLNLLQIVQNNIYLYTTSTAAENSNYNFLIDYSVIKAGPTDTSIPQTQYIIWTGGFYLGKDSLGNVQNSQTIPSLITQGYTCPTILRPNPFEITNTTISDGGFNVYYAFAACGPDSLSQNPSNPRDIYPVYLVDVGHGQADSNYISDFVDYMLANNKPVFSIGDGCDCIEYVHKVESQDIGSASQLLQTYYTNVQVVTPQSLGIVSQGTVTIYSDCANCGLNTNGTTYTFPVIQQDPPIVPGPNMDIEKNYKLDNVSKPLLRTNPKLSTNVKLVVDETGRIYFDSINANRGLANSIYKRRELDKNSRYSYDLARYWNDNETPIDSTFDVLREYSDTSVLDSYDKQFEEEYHYGTKLNNSKLYSEQFRMFAPIWVDYNLPKKFVIYRIDDPNPELNLKDSAVGKQERILRLVKNSRIVKVFDLSTKTSVGTYLNNHVQDELFPQAPLTITMEKDEKSSYNGIDLLKGGFVEKSEYIYNDFVKEDKPLIDANDFITDGFRRNKVASANLINLEFLFNDPTAEDYSVNRYFGLYVDDFDSGIGEVSYYRNNIIKFRSLESYLEGSDPTFAIPEYRLLHTTGALGYVKLRDSFYNIDPSKVYNASRYTVSVKASDEEINSNLGIFNKQTSVELKSNPNGGPDFIKFKVIDSPQTNDSFKVSQVKRESVRFKIIKNINGDTVVISDDFSNQIQFDTGVDANSTWTNLQSVWDAIGLHIEDSNNPLPANNGAAAISFYQRYDLSLEATNQINSIVFTERSSSLVDNGIVATITGSTIIASDEIYTNVDPTRGLLICDNSLPAKRFTTNTFSGNGTLSDIAFSIAEALRVGTDYDTFNIGEYVYVRNNVNGYRLMNATLLVNLFNNVDFIEAENEDTSNELNLSSDILSLFKAYFFNGGHSGGKSIYIRSNVISEISTGDFIPTKYPNVYNQVLDVVEDTDSQDGEYYKLILKDKTVLKDGEYEVYSKNRMSIGLFSAYDIYDMNFDFYDTSNSDLKELELETKENMYYDPYEDAIDPSTTSVLPADGIIDVEDWEKSPIDYFANLLPVLGGEDSAQITPGRISSEYDRLKENSQKEFATNSRVVPSINKWVLKDSMTVREEPYYLNVNEAFGRTNFSPDITVDGRNEEAFTHEWFYIDEWPDYFEYPFITNPSTYSDHYNKGFSYVNHIYNFSMDRSLFTSTQYDYFDRFMVTEGTETQVPIDTDGDNIPDINPIFWSKTELRKKYTLIQDGNDSDFAKTILKGLKYTFKTRKQSQNTATDEFVKNSEFNGYRFSVLLKTKTNSNSNSVDYEFIKNEKYKFVILYITLNIDDSFVNYINRKYLYELQHKLFKGTDPSTGNDIYNYANVNIDGALYLSSIQTSSPGPYTINGIPNINGTTPRFDQQIAQNENELYGRIEIDYGLANKYYVDVLRVIGSNSLEIRSLPYYIDPVTSAQVFLNTNFLTYSQQASATYIYEGGGVNAYDILLRSLSARSFVESLQSNDGSVTFTTVDENGVETQNEYSVEVDDGTEIIKESKLEAQVDNDTPKSYKLKKETIGHVLVETNPYYPFLIRHSGKYTVDFNPVVTFTDVYGFNKAIRNQKDYNSQSKILKENYYKLNLSSTYEINKSMAFYKKYNRLGVAFNVGFISDGGDHDSNWGMIKNHFYHKVNEINPNGVTKLSDSTEYLPLYPLINEIAIDRRDVNVFRSSWEDEYYVRSKSGGEIDLIPGTISTVEERSYLGSTVIKFKPSYSIYEFTSSSVGTQAELDDILRSVNPPADVVLFEDDSNILIDFYLSDITAKLIGSDGLDLTIANFVDPLKSEGDKSTISDDVIFYATNNMINLYSIDSIQLYVRQYKGTSSEVVSATAIDQIDNGGYNLDQSFTYQLHGKKPLNFRLIYNKKLGYSYSIQALIKIQA